MQPITPPAYPCGLVVDDSGSSGMMAALKEGHTMTLLAVGQKAPDFRLETQNNNLFSLNDLKGKWAVIYFYPKALTSGCTTQACALRDGHAELNDLGAEVVGISPDEVKLVTKFALKEGVNFTLLADPDHAVCDAYGVWQQKSMYGRSYMGAARVTYIVNPEGVIAHVIPKVSPGTHLDEVKAWLTENAR